MTMRLVSPLILPTVVLAASSPVVESSIDGTIKNKDTTIKEDGAGSNGLKETLQSDLEPDSVNK